MMTPASLALIGEAYPDPTEKARAIGYWAVGGAIASAAGPLVGGALTTISWRLIFLINLPIGALALWLLSGISHSRRHDTVFDWAGQAAALISLTALTFGLIEAGHAGLSDPTVVVSIVIAAIAGILFLILQAQGQHPMVPLGLFQSRAVATAVAIGFTFMVGFYGMVFLVSLLLQQQRGLTPFQTGLAFVPVTGFSIFIPVIAARIAERLGAWAPIAAGQAMMAAGLFLLSSIAATASIPVLIAAMVPVGFGAATAMPTATSLLLNTVPQNRAGTASGVLNTSRQVGGAMAIAAFGALIVSQGFDAGMKVSCIIAGALLVSTMLVSFRLRQR
jgi:DHA2 family methylenomycin A resistance protein-like MFS transporter